MMSFLFSPFGRVGRFGWWMTYLGYLALFMGVAFYLAHTARLANFATPLDHATASGFGAEKFPSRELLLRNVIRMNASIRSATTSFPGGPVTLAALFLVVMWPRLAIEIKRWQDRGLSGFCLLLGGVPWLFHGYPVAFGLIGLMIGLWKFIQLGFLDSAKVPAGETRRSSAPAFSKWKSWAPLVSASVLMIGLFFRIEKIALESTVPPESPYASSVPAANPAIPDEAAYHGTRDTRFGKDWVLIDGKRIAGITRANPAPDAQIALLYSDGGRNVSAASLPQGFLDLWNLTPDRLKAVDQP